MSNLVLHIPHASTNIPNFEGFTLSLEEIEREVILITDLCTDELFSFDQAVTIRAGFSRLFCDAERYSDDSLEVMSSHGMGMAYIRTDSGQLMRKVTPSLREKILEQYYWPHHKRLENAVSEALADTGKALIIDAHSFPDKPFQRDLDKSPDRPDICLGTDEFHTSKSLLRQSESFFTARGMTVEVNRPYSGTIVPLSFLGKNRAVQSIMIEVNRKLYLEDGTNKKSREFLSLKNLIQEYLKLWLS